jgi:nitrite reductase/ring-hydroxylating ferredoxin subunit
LPPEQHVQASTSVPPWAETTVRFDELAEGGRRLLGESNHLGLSVVRSQGRVLVFPRLCPHEGANLDDSPRGEGCALSCPWHGRKFKPIVSLDLPATPRVLETPWHRYVVTPQALTVACKPTDASLRDADWSREAA